MHRDEAAARVLHEVARREAEVRFRTVAPWQCAEARRHAAEKRYGPRYSPAWFGAAAASEAGRVRFLRAVHALERAGLLAAKKVGRQLRHVRLTAKGRAAAALVPAAWIDQGAGAAEALPAA
jgi:hypothetical protein